jgi:hypothetical protein
MVGAVMMLLLAAATLHEASAAPLPASPSWMGESDNVGAWYGRSVATAGDVNGDGHSDVIVGAFQYSNDRALEGAAFLYLGSAAGLSTTADWVVEGDQDGAYLGECVAPAGDINADGYDDVIIGVPGWTESVSRGGQVRVYYGSPAGLGSAPDWVITGTLATHRFGASVSGAGDVDGDGYQDILVGDPIPDGRAYLHRGSAAGLSGTPSWVGQCDQALAYYGMVSGIGDVNGDGYDDIAVGAYRYSSGESEEGRVFVHHGGAAGVSGLSWVAESNQAGSDFGFAVARAGDVNADGFADLVVGAPTYGSTDTGRTFLFRGSAIGLEAAASWSLNGQQAGERSGYAVSAAGDVNADGFADLVIGALDYDNPSAAEGRALLFMGSPSGLGASSTWTAESNQSGAYFGISVAGAGDVNGDGMSDVAIGAFHYDAGEFDEGRAYVYYGATAPPTLTASWSAEGNQSNAYFGTSLVMAGDVNGDGLTDVLVGAPTYDLGETDEGRVFLYPGTSSGPATNATWSAEGNSAGCRFGTSASGAGDVNGDGFVDLVIGAPDFNGVGRVFIYHGSSSGPAPSAAVLIDGDQSGAQFGASVASAGDVNADGYGDVVVGAPLYDQGQTDEGKAFLYLGSATGLVATAVWSAEGNVASGDFGRVVGCAGDVNADGHSEVVIGAPNWYDLYPAQNQEGAVFVFRGSETGVEASASWFLDGDAPGMHFGASVGCAGDVNGDGFSDLTVGAPGYNGSEGVAHLFHGSSAGLATSPSWSYFSGFTASAFGQSVSGAGDVNGDGFSDLIVGAPWYNGSGSPSESSEGAAFLFLGSAAGMGSTIVWQIEGNAIFRLLGQLVVGGGDTNGDGLADVAYGIQWETRGQANEGAAYVHLGNEIDGLDVRARQRQADDTAPIAVRGRSSSGSSFRIEALARSAAGRQRVALEWEVKPVGVPFDGSGLVRSSFIDTGSPGGQGSVVPISATVTGLTAETPYAWRVRVVGPSAMFPHSLWFSPPETGRTEADVRTGEAPVAVGDDLSPAQGPIVGHLSASPNPFNPRTTLRFTLGHPGHVDVRVFDAGGRMVAAPMSGRLTAGPQAIAWEARRTDGGPLPSGIYIVRVDMSGESTTQKITLLQ